MKIQYATPTTEKLISIYNHYQSNKVNLNYFLNSYYWCRYDARLGELLIEFMKNNWTYWNPFEVARQLKHHQWPQVFGVLGGHVALLLTKGEKKTFLKWLDCCFYQVSFEKEMSVFFIGVFKFGGKQLRNEAFDSIALYSKWGYYAKTPMVNFRFLSSNPKRTFIKKEQRLEKLKDLFAIKKRIRIQDYIEYLDYKVSKRTAELDLNRWANKTGETKGATYTFFKSHVRSDQSRAL